MGIVYPPCSIRFSPIDELVSRACICYLRPLRDRAVCSFHALRRDSHRKPLQRQPHSDYPRRSVLPVLRAEQPQQHHARLLSLAADSYVQP